MNFIRVSRLPSSWSLSHHFAVHQSSILHLQQHPSAVKNNFRYFSNVLGSDPSNHDQKETSATEIPKLIAHSYETNHSPLIFKKQRPYGEPYTNTKLLEQIPEPAYEQHLEPEGFGDRFVLGKGCLSHY